MKIASFNINNVNTRLPTLLRWLRDAKPDVVCPQELKSELAGANVGEKVVVDISIGQHWSKHCVDNGLEDRFGQRSKYPHRYPDSHPQSLSNPQESWCYPLDSLGYYRKWLQDEYIAGGRFSRYIEGKVTRGELPPSIAQLAITAVAQPPIISLSTG